MLDADDLWLENHLEDCLNTLLKLNSDGLYSGIYFINNHSANITSELCRGRQLNEKESMADYLLNYGYGASTPTLFMKTHCVKNILWDPDLIDLQDYDFVIRFSKKYNLRYKNNMTTICRLMSNRKPHFESYNLFFNKHRKEISAYIYTKYCYRIMIYTEKNRQDKSIINYFKQETLRYKECISYQHYINLLKPSTYFLKLKYKFNYLFYLIFFLFLEKHK